MNGGGSKSQSMNSPRAPTIASLFQTPNRHEGAAGSNSANPATTLDTGEQQKQLCQFVLDIVPLVKTIRKAKREPETVASRRTRVRKSTNNDEQQSQSHFLSSERTPSSLKAVRKLQLNPVERVSSTYSRMNLEQAPADPTQKSPSAPRSRTPHPSPLHGRPYLNQFGGVFHEVQNLPHTERSMSEPPVTWRSHIFPTVNTAATKSTVASSGACFGQGQTSGGENSVSRKIRAAHDLQLMRGFDQLVVMSNKLDEV